MRQKYYFEVSTPVVRINNMLTNIDSFCLLFIDAMKAIAQMVLGCFCVITAFSLKLFSDTIPAAAAVIVRVNFKLFVVLKLVFGNGSVIWCYTVGAS